MDSLHAGLNAMNVPIRTIWACFAAGDCFLL